MRHSGATQAYLQFHLLNRLLYFVEGNTNIYNCFNPQRILRAVRHAQRNHTGTCQIPTKFALQFSSWSLRERAHTNGEADRRIQPYMCSSYAHCADNTLTYALFLFTLSRKHVTICTLSIHTVQITRHHMHYFYAHCAGNTSPYALFLYTLCR